MGVAPGKKQTGARRYQQNKAKSHFGATNPRGPTGRQAYSGHRQDSGDREEHNELHQNVDTHTPIIDGIDLSGHGT